mmetsp:Transcript_81058/g.216487  ORF Transcript_81058/g.216487 Transcript_81058/m.216487 type:complete len:292 (+) Transcript_81058:706-1581(+)
MCFADDLQLPMDCEALLYLPGWQQFLHGWLEASVVFCFIKVLKGVGRLSRPPTMNYAAQIVMAINAVHTLGFIHRDLKPENIALDHRGKIKLLDFGLARSHPAGNQSAMSTVGTPHYMAPEMVLGAPYTRSVDWWSLGMLILDCMEPALSVAPFTTEEMRAVGEGARKHLKEKFKQYVECLQKALVGDDEDATDFVRKLLVHPRKRLDVYGIMKHAFFSPLELGFHGPEGQEMWSDKEVLDMDDLYRPTVDGPDDISLVGCADDPTFEPFPTKAPCSQPKLRVGRYSVMTR